METKNGNVWKIVVGASLVVGALALLVSIILALLTSADAMMMTIDGLLPKEIVDIHLIVALGASAFSCTFVGLGMFIEGMLGLDPSGRELVNKRGRERMKNGVALVKFIGFSAPGLAILSASLANGAYAELPWTCLSVGMLLMAVRTYLYIRNNGSISNIANRIMRYGLLLTLSLCGLIVFSDQWLGSEKSDLGFRILIAYSLFLMFIVFRWTVEIDIAEGTTYPMGLATPSEAKDAKVGNVLLACLNLVVAGFLVFGLPSDSGLQAFWIAVGIGFAINAIIKLKGLSNPPLAPAKP